MNKKGFTLIELLAVIVILAIIALISMPIIIGIIDDARKGAAEDSAYGVAQAGDYYYVQALYKNGGSFDGYECTYGADTSTLPSCSGTNGLTLKGTKPTGGTVKIESDGTVNTTDLIINGFKVNKGSDGKYSAEKQ